MKYKYYMLLALFLVSLGSSLVLSLVPISQICDPGVGCDVVQHSSYAYTFGIKNNYYGVVLFAVGSFLIFSQIKKPTKNKRNLIHATVIIGSLVALYFIYLQRFVLHAFCKYCIAVDFSILLAMIVIIFEWEN